MNSKVKDSKILAAFKPGEQLDTAQVLSRVRCMSEMQVFRSMIRLEKRGYMRRFYDDIYIRYPWGGGVWTEEQRREEMESVRFENRHGQDPTRPRN